MSYFYLHFKITSTLTSKREYYSSNKTLFNGTNFYKTQKHVLLQDNMQLLMSNIQNKNTLYVNFNKRKREYIVIPIIPIGVT